MTHGSPGLDVFRDPASVTVVGASADPAKWGWWLAQGALRGAHRRDVHLVNRSGGELLGRRTSRSLAEVPGDLGLVALGIPAAGVPDVVEEALARGARGFLGITAGLGAVEERRLAERIRGAGARLVGPNCLGLYDATTELQLAWGHFRAGRLAIVSQSGQVGSELAELAAARGLGVSRFVSLGNQVDVGAAEVLADLVDHDATAVVALYLESFGDGAALLEAIHALRAAGRPTLLLTVGGSEASRGAAASHTGALTSDLDVVDAACRAAGAVRVDTPQQLVDAAHLLAFGGRPRGRRVAVVGDSGGQVAVAADVLGRAGLELPALSADGQRGIAELLPAGAGVANPVDLAGAGEADLDRYADVVEHLVDSDVDAVVLTGYFGSYAAHCPALKEREQAVAERIAAAGSRTPFVVHSMAVGTDVLGLLEERGVATFHTVDAVSVALDVATRLGPGRSVAPADSTSSVPAPGYLAAREWLEGVRFPRAEGVTSTVELESAAGALRPPYVLKADWIAHKTEHDAVRVGLPDPGALRAAYDEMSERLGPGRYVVEELDTRQDVTELIVGARREPSFGPVVLVGAGGTWAEVLRDTTLELAPVDRTTARAMVARLQVLPLLTGFRGRPVADLDALADLVVAASRAIATAPPEVSEIELNPLRVGHDGVVAVDALVVTGPPSGG